MKREKRFLLMLFVIHTPAWNVYLSAMSLCLIDYFTRIAVKSTD